MDTNKIDLFDLLKRIDNSDFYYYSELTPEQRKSISLVVLARWLSCTKNKDQIITLNALVNPFTYTFATKHPQLLYKLMLISSSSTEKHYKWVSKKKKDSSKSNTIKVISEYYGISLMKAEGSLTLLNCSDVIDYANALGYDNAFIKKIKNEYK